MNTEVRKNPPGLERALIGLWAAIEGLKELETADHECEDEFCACWDAGGVLFTLEIYRGVLESVAYSFPEWTGRQLAEERASMRNPERIALLERSLKRQLAERATAEASPPAESPVENSFYAQA